MSRKKKLPAALYRIGILLQRRYLKEAVITVGGRRSPALVGWLGMCWARLADPIGARGFAARDPERAELTHMPDMADEMRAHLQGARILCICKRCMPSMPGGGRGSAAIERRGGRLRGEEKPRVIWMPKGLGCPWRQWRRFLYSPVAARHVRQGMCQMHGRGWRVTCDI